MRVRKINANKITVEWFNSNGDLLVAEVPESKITLFERFSWFKILQEKINKILNYFLITDTDLKNLFIPTKTLFLIDRGLV